MRPDEREAIARAAADLRNHTHAADLRCLTDDQAPLDPAPTEGLRVTDLKLLDTLAESALTPGHTPDCHEALRRLQAWRAALSIHTDDQAAVGVLPDPAPSDQGAEGRGGEIPLYRWRLNEDSPWRVTDWEGVPDDPEETSDLCRLPDTETTEGSGGRGDVETQAMDALADHHWETAFPDTEITEGLVRVELTREEAEAMLMGLDSAPWTDAVSTTFAKITAALADEGETE